MENGIFRWREQKLSDSAGKATEMMELKFYKSHTHTHQLNILAELNSLPLCHDGIHTCTLTDTQMHARAHAQDTWRHVHAVFHAANCQFERSKLSCTPYFSCNEKQVWSPSFSHAHTLTQVSNIYPDWMLASPYVLYFTKGPDQRLHTGPVKICSSAWIVSIVMTDLLWISFA